MNPQNKPIFKICTIGHQYHGKTTLISALTAFCAAYGYSKKVDCETITSQKPMFIPENNTLVFVSYVEFETDEKKYTCIDCSANKDYKVVLNSEGAGINCAILVVSAPDGPMPDTHEQLLLCREMGISNIIVYLNKCEIADEMDDELTELVEFEIEGVLKNTQASYDYNIPIIRGSALAALNGEDSLYGTKSIERLMAQL